MMKHLAALAVATVLGLAVPAYASPVTYDLSATLNTGTASGTVTYDPSTGAISGGSLSVYSLIDNDQETFSFSSGGTGSAVFSGPVYFFFSDIFDLYLGGTNASPTVSTGSFENRNFFGSPDGTNDYVVSGSLTPDVPVSVTPEPSSLVLLGTGVLGVAGAARRRFLKR